MRLSTFSALRRDLEQRQYWILQLLAVSPVPRTFFTGARCLDDKSTPQYVNATFRPAHIILATFSPMRQLTTATLRPKMTYCQSTPESGRFVACQCFDHCDNRSFRQFVHPRFHAISTVPSHLLNINITHGLE
jgi:hypothetical protein